MAFNLTPELSFLIGLVAFWIVLYLISYLFHLEKRGLEVKPGYFMFRSKALNSSLDKLAKKQPLLWKVLSNVGVAFSLGLMAFGLYFFINNLLGFASIGGGSYIAPIVPGITLSLYWLPFFIFAVIVVVLPHELAHGIVARLEDIPVLSTGVVAFLVLFGAFVEPDEKEFEKSSLLARLRMLSAGSSTNLVTALLASLLLVGVFSAPAGVLISRVIPDTPLAESGFGVQQWDVIKAINNTNIQSYVQYSELMKDVGPDVTVTVTILHENQKQNITLITVPNPQNGSKGMIGFEVSFIPDYRPSYLGLDQYNDVNLHLTLFWVYLVAFSIAVVNMLPLYPFDGERVLYYPLERLVKKRKRELRIALSAFTWGLFASNIVLSLWRFGLLAI